MSRILFAVSLSVAIGIRVFAQAPTARLPTSAEMGGPHIDDEVPLYELTDGSLMDGLSELSRNKSMRLHLGIEEVLRTRITDPVDRSVGVSLHVEHKSVRDVLNALCAADSRYAWSIDQATINVYPVARFGDSTDLLNFRIEQLSLANLPNPDQALFPMSKLFPGEQVGYFHNGPDNAYAEPWTFTFEHISVREFINRINEHMGPQSSWIWQGGKDARAFNFIKGGFH